MFWRQREKDSPDQNGTAPCGQVRVLVVGDAGVGKTSLVHLIVKGSALARPSQTVGCSVSVKHITYGRPSSSSNSIKNDSERDFFVELWEVSGHKRYKKCRSIFYSQINGVIFVHDLSQRKTKANIHKWALEIAEGGTFSAPLGSGGPGGLPVPFLVISNKADIAVPPAGRGSSGNLVDAARLWVERQGLLPPAEDIPLTDSFPGTKALVSVRIKFSFDPISVIAIIISIIIVTSILIIKVNMRYLSSKICSQAGLAQSTPEMVELWEAAAKAAKEGRYDKEAIVKFFLLLIRRRYFPEEQPGPSPWSLSPATSSVFRSSDISSDDDQSLRYARYNGMVPLPAQRNLTPPTTMYPQQPVTTPAENYGYNRYAVTRMLETGGTARSNRADINV